jgi:hypothetical protein
MICMTVKSILRSNFVSQALHFAAGCDVSKPDFIRQSGDKLVSADGETCGNAAVMFGKTGENQETTVGERLLPGGQKAHILKTSGRTDNNGLASAQKDAETLHFHRRMKTTDDAPANIAPPGNLVVRG